MNFAADDKKWHFICFTESGRILSEVLLKQVTYGQVYFKNTSQSLHEYVAYIFEQHLTSKNEVMVFVSATGIAVRTVASFIKDKLTDPPVIVIDDRGNHVISLLSGHAGGANAATLWLVNRLNSCGYTSIPVITTATENRGVKGIEDLLMSYNVPLTPVREAIKAINMHLANGGHIRIHLDPLLGSYEQEEETIYDKSELSVAISLRHLESWCHQTPFDYVFTSKSLVVGTGCRRRLEDDAYFCALQEALDEKSFLHASVAYLSSVSLKADEACLLNASNLLGAPLKCHDVETLKKYEYLYKGSTIVLEQVGISAVAGPSAQILTEDSLAMDVIKKRGCTFAFGRLIK